MLLFFYFGTSRIILIALGLISLQQPPDILRFLVQVVVAYLFFQGLRGTLVFHYLTHSQYPAAAAMPEVPVRKE